MSEIKNPVYLVMVEPGNNNNKWYKMLPDPNGSTWTAQYGRIGVDGYQTAQYDMSQWDKKYKEKTRKGYVDQSRLVAQISTPVSKKREYADIPNYVIAQIVQRLQSFAKVAIEENYTISSNKVTQKMIDEAQIALNSLINTNNLEEFNKILVNLFTIIPRKMSKVVLYLAQSKDDYGKIIEREQDLLDVMKGQVVVGSVIDEEVVDNEPVNKQTILDIMGLKFEEINESDRTIIKNSLGPIKHRFHQGWKVINLKTQDKFDKFVKNNCINDIKLLWHGSKSANFWSIINIGLLLKPNAPITGKMFGHGCYFSCDSEKSLNYTDLAGAYWTNGTSNFGFMGLFNVAYGKPYDVYSFDSKYYNLNYENLQKICPGSHSLHAHGGTGMLRKDEIVIYKEEQCTIQYLIELR
jgi:poly [ADP-ribose] polymerase